MPQHLCSFGAFGEARDGPHPVPLNTQAENVQAGKKDKSNTSINSSDHLFRTPTHRVFWQALFFLLLLPSPAAGISLFTGRLVAQQTVQLLPPHQQGRRYLQLQTIREVPQSANAVLHNLIARRGRQGSYCSGLSQEWLTPHSARSVIVCV